MRKREVPSETCSNCDGTGATYNDPNCYACACLICEGTGKDSGPNYVTLFDPEPT